MSVNLTTDELLAEIGRRRADAANIADQIPALDSNKISPGAPDNNISNELWSSLERHLQERGRALAAGDEAPGLPDDLAGAMLDSPALARAYRELAQPVAQALAGRLPAAKALPDKLLGAIRAEAAKNVRLTAAQAGEPESAGAVEKILGSLTAAIGLLGEKWSALQLEGFALVESELLLARGAAGSPLALQGKLGDNYLVAMSIGGDPASGGAVVNLQCQEVKPGAVAPRPVPAFCLRDESGKRHHSRDRIAHVEALAPGRHVFHLEVVGKNQGSIVLDIGDKA